MSKHHIWTIPQNSVLCPYLDCQGVITPSSGPPISTRCSNCSKLLASVDNTREKGIMRGREIKRRKYMQVLHDAGTNKLC